VTATPCNACPVCLAIDAGRFVDYIEMDAASNRGVEEMTQVLERAIYAPSNARFKVYMIDEVHMLTQHAFNAMLKTLEEPPDWVKFILATTDPQKIPPTVLSRCLQFSLKPVAPARIAARLAEVLQSEGLEPDAAALRLIARAARGSLRDALSLLDQAIAFAGGAPGAAAVQEMLGAVDAAALAGLLECVLAGDAPQALARSAALAAAGLSYAQVLRDLADLLHRVALAQAAPAALEEDPDAPTLLSLAARLDRGQVQLAYQIALHGRDDLPLAPDEFAGFSMTLLRMMAFLPEHAGAVAPVRGAALQAARPPRASAPLPASAARESAAKVRAATASPAPSPAGATKAAAAAPLASAAAGKPPAGTGPAQDTEGDWPALAASLELSGLARELASHCELVKREDDHFTLRTAVRALAGGAGEARLRAALASRLGREVRLTLQVGATRGPTAAVRAQEEQAASQRRAEDAIYADPLVRQLIEDFGASVDPRSIRPASGPGTAPPGAQDSPE
jgi:DNA polymerase-3 subunit gamma/tau